MKATPTPLGVDPISLEYEALRRCAGPGVVEAIEIDEAEPPAILVLEHVRGTSLEQRIAERAPSITELLDIASAVAKTLARIHRARYLHGSIEPSHVLIGSDGSTRLIGFGLAHEFGAPQRARPLHTLRYGAPEHTGRMARGADFRSDLYAFGGTLYYALSGRPPFEDQDPLTLMHAHLARPIPSLLALRPELPATLARIVAKLLEKDPEDRYQTAEALHFDLLECRTQLQHTGRIDDELPLGTADAPQRPLFPRRLYGREHECARLESAYRRIARGGSELWLISGPPGIGKSALVDQLRRPLLETGGYLARGKFDLYRRDRPYHGLAAALDGWTQQLLTESEARLAAWRTEIADELGDLAAVAVDLVPDLGLVLGSVPSVPRLGPREARSRLALALQRLIRAVARMQHPLVLFLDDLQWADDGSLYVIEELMSGRAPEALMLIGSYRDNEVDPDHPLTALLQRLAERKSPQHGMVLGPMSRSAAALMLAEALQRSFQDVQALVDCVGRKTANLPLLIQHFVLHLHERGLLHYRTGAGWIWNDAEVGSADIPDGAVALMTAKLRALDGPVRQAIEFASCVGDEFDAAMLAELSGKDKAALERSLFVLGETGLIAPCQNGFRFVHDRIREAAQSLLDAAERASLHLATARILMDNLSDSELDARILEVADHLNRALEQIPDVERIRAAEINLRAARRALAGGTGSSAERYLAAARQLFEEKHWPSHTALGFDLHLVSAESAALCGHVSLALELLDSLRPRIIRPLQEMQLRTLRLRLLAANRGPTEAVEYLLDSLRLYGIRWPRHPSQLRLAFAMRRCERLRRRARGEHVSKHDAGADVSNVVAVLQLLNAAGGAMYRYDARLGTLAIGKAIQLMTQIGVDPTSVPYLLAVYAVYRRRIHDRTGAMRYSELALERAARRADTARDHRAEHVVYSLVRPWYTARRTCIGPLEIASERAREAGDAEFADLAILCALRFRILAGNPLALCRLRLNAALEDRSGKPEVLTRLLGLLDFAEDPGRLAYLDVSARIEVAPENAAEVYALTTDLACEMLVLCIHGRFDRAWAKFEHVGAALMRVAPGPTLADAMLMRGLCAAELAHAGSMRRRRLLRILARCCRELTRLAREGPDFGHMAELLGAERARLRGREHEARTLYARAAKHAAERGFRHHAALAHERHAELLRSTRRSVDSDRELAAAAALYRSWGAIRKARALTERMSVERLQSEPTRQR